MSQPELLEKVIAVLNSAAIDYMITGSIVSSLQGEPRATHDIDIVVAITNNAIQQLVQAFALPEYFLDQDTIREAVDHQSMFNLIDLDDGDKVDFWILSDEPFDRSRFSRKYSQSFLGLELLVSRPEDTIIAKLRWAKLSGGSEKQFIDALRVYEVQYEILNRPYLDEWASRLELEDLWERLQKEAVVIT